MQDTNNTLDTSIILSQNRALEAMRDGRHQDYVNTLQDIPEKDIIEALFTPITDGVSLFAASTGKSQFFNTTLQMMPKDDRHRAVTLVDISGRSILSHLAHYPQSFDTALNVVPEKHRLHELTKVRDTQGLSAHDWASCIPTCKPVADKHIGISLAALERDGSQERYDIGGINVHIPNLRNSLPQLSEDIQESYRNTVSIYKIPAALAAMSAHIGMVTVGATVAIRVKTEEAGVDLNISERKVGGLHQPLVNFFRNQANQNLSSAAIQQQYGREGDTPRDFVTRLQQSAANPKGLGI